MYLFNRNARFVLVGLMLFSIGTVATAQTKPGTPYGWKLHGTRADKYECGIDSDSTRDGKPSAYLKGLATTIAGNGEVVQYISPEKYLGQRLRLSGWLKTKDIQDLAGLWMRVSGPNNELMGFDDMESHPVKGTTDWKKYSVVLDVPPEAKEITFGFSAYGPGMVWANGLELDTVDKTVETTNSIQRKKLPVEPVNIEFATSK